MTKKNRRGFSLIEAAIVLGVVGLVIGGIWIAASAVRENLKIERTNEIITLAAKKIVTALKEVRTGTYPDGTNITTLATSIGAIPPDGKTPLGVIIVITDTDFNARGFVLNLAGLNSKTCTKVVSRHSSLYKKTGLVRVSFYPAIIHYASFPIPMNIVSQNCKNTTSIFLGYTY